MTDRTLQVLGGDECYRLLAGGGVGRIGLNAHPYPLILPVDYGLDEAGVIVLRTAEGTAVDSAHHVNVSFEVDHLDRADGSGWSVLVHGLAERLTDAHDAALVDRTRHTGVTPSAPGARDRWFRLIPQAISGRRFPGRLRHGGARPG